MGEECRFSDGRAMIDKIREMGFSQNRLPVPFEIECRTCGATFRLETCEGRCPSCETTYGVTPCHANDPRAVRAAGVRY